MERNGLIAWKSKAVNGQKGNACMQLLMERVYSLKTKQKKQSLEEKIGEWQRHLQSCRMKSGCCFYLPLITPYPSSPVLSSTLPLCTGSRSSDCHRVNCNVSVIFWPPKRSFPTQHHKQGKVKTWKGTCGIGQSCSICPAANQGDPTCFI